MKAKNTDSEVIKGVLQTYNTIGTEFDVSRRRQWPEFEALEKEIVQSQAQRILDAGCGNGRVAHLLKNLPVTYRGYDGSKTLIGQAKKWWAEESKPLLHAQFSVGSLLKKRYSVPFDAIISSAVLHHLPTPELQAEALALLNAQLSKKGFIYISVWNLWQPKYVANIDSSTKACYVPWGTEKRFYYAFTEKELRLLLKKTGFTTLQKIPSTHNFCFIAWKK